MVLEYVFRSCVCFLVSGIFWCYLLLRGVSWKWFVDPIYSAICGREKEGGRKEGRNHQAKEGTEAEKEKAGRKGEADKPKLHHHSTRGYARQAPIWFEMVECEAPTK